MTVTDARRITLPITGVFDERVPGVVYYRSDEWVVVVVPMIYNDRICLARADSYTQEYVAGFCYDKGGAAHLSAAVWDPTKTHEPVGYKKVACDSRPQERR